jgi:hypothetical protein
MMERTFSPAIEATEEPDCFGRHAPDLGLAYL